MTYGELLGSALSKETLYLTASPLLKSSMLAGAKCLEDALPTMAARSPESMSILLLIASSPSMTAVSGLSEKTSSLYPVRLLNFDMTESMTPSRPPVPISSRTASARSETYLSLSWLRSRPISAVYASIMLDTAERPVYPEGGLENAFLEAATASESGSDEAAIFSARTEYWTSFLAGSGLERTMMPESTILSSMK